MRIVLQEKFVKPAIIKGLVQVISKFNIPSSKIWAECYITLFYWLEQVQNSMRHLKKLTSVEPAYHLWFVKNLEVTIGRPKSHNMVDEAFRSQLNVVKGHIPWMGGDMATTLPKWGKKEKTGDSEKRRNRAGDSRVGICPNGSQIQNNLQGFWWKVRDCICGCADSQIPTTLGLGSDHISQENFGVVKRRISMRGELPQSLSIEIPRILRRRSFGGDGGN